LVNIPVKLFSAVRQKEVHFHMLHEKDGARISQKRFCTKEDKEVPYEDIVKGYEVSRGKYVAFTRKELQALERPSTRSIDIEDFVELSEIDPIFYESSYHIAPDRSAKPYALLLEVMKKTGRVGIARFVMRTKQYLCAVRPMDGALTLSTMLYADEIVSSDELKGDEKWPTPSSKELAMATQLVESLSSKFKPEKYKDDYREELLGLIAKKAKGHDIEIEQPEQKRGKVIDLMDALKKSLEKGGEKEGGRRPAMRAARSRSRSGAKRRAAR
jgi:DNA end-binding protein Ku